MWSPTGVEARKISARLFRQLAEELDGYAFHHERGCLNLFTAEQWADARKLLTMYDRLDADYEQMTAGEVRERWPCLAPSADVVGLLDPNGGYSEPHEYLPALERRVRWQWEHSPSPVVLLSGGRDSRAISAAIRAVSRSASA